MSYIYNSLSVEHLLGRPLDDAESKNSPALLYCAGPMEIPLPFPRISVIGSRAASKAGLDEAREASKYLAKNGIVVVSGLARGIDTAAHEAAIHAGGNTIAVIGTPIDRTYPKENAMLQADMMDGQLVVSQFPASHHTVPGDFVLRNHTMALISDGTVVVEAGESSGALYQCWETLRLGRPLFIGKTVLGNNSLAWPQKMLERGAVPLDDPETIIDSVSHDGISGFG